NQVCFLLRVLDACERHRRSGDIGTRCLQELADVLEVPSHAAALRELAHSSGVAKAFMRSDRTIDDAPQIWADPVWATLLGCVTSSARAEGRLARISICCCEEFDDRRAG